VDTQNAMRADEWMKKGKLVPILEDRDGKMPLTCVDKIVGLIGYGAIGEHLASRRSMLMYADTLCF